MKDFFKFSFVALLMISAIACDGPSNIESDGKEGEPVNEQLTSEETTQRLRSTAQKIVDTFDAQDQKEAVAFAEFFIYEFTNFEFDWGEFEDIYTSDSYKSIWSMPRYALDVAQGRRLASQVSDYTFDFRNESVTFEANDESRTWVCKGPNDDNSITFIYTASGKKCIAKVWGEGSTKTYTTDVTWKDWHYGEKYDEYGNYMGYEEWSEDVNKTYSIVMPEKIICTLSDETTEYVRVEVMLDMKKNDYIRAKVNGKVANLNWKVEANVESTHAEFAMSYNYDNTNLVAVEGTVPNYVVLDKEDDQTWQEWIELYGEQYESLIEQAGGASAKVYLLDQAQIVTKAESAAKFYNAYRAWDRKYPYNGELDWHEQSYRQRGAQVELADIYNDNIYVGVYYNSDIEQMQIKMDVRQYTDEYWDWETDSHRNVNYYGTVPVLYFPIDGTSYEFEEYFTETRFRSVLNITEDLVNQYINLLRYFEFDPVEF